MMKVLLPTLSIVFAASPICRSASAQRPLTGLVEEVDPAGSVGVQIEHSGRTQTARLGQSLSGGDIVRISKPATRALLLVNNKEVVLTPGSGPFVVPPAHQGLDWQSLIGKIAYALKPSGAEPNVIGTTPKSLLPLVEPSPWLPAQEQTIRAGKPFILLVVWRGAPAGVVLSSPTAIIASAAPDQAGSAFLSLPALAAGSYELKVGDFLIPVMAVDQNPIGTPPDKETLSSLSDVFDHPDRRLQALSDLSALSSRNALARAVVEKAVRNENPAALASQPLR